MGSPFRPSLYRRAWALVTCAALALSTGLAARAQLGRGPTAKGPRAMGLLQLAPNGKAHLLPITVMVDGRFYDASAYKADPVPFALESEVVYEAVRAGVSQGLFTVTGALQGQNTWLGEGRWVPAGTAPKKAARSDEKPNLEDDSGPPTLRKSGSQKNPSAPPTPPSGPAPTPPTPPAPASPNSKPGSSPDNSAGSAGSQSSDSSSAENDVDPNRPMLRRGTTQPLGGSTAPSKKGGASPTAPSASKEKTGGKETSVQLIPAISDAHGPEPRPYAYSLKPDEEQGFRKKMLALAATEVEAKAKQMTPVLPGAAPAKRAPAKPPAKPAGPTFDDVEFRAFDLWNTNEPVFVLSAKAHLPAGSAATTKAENTYFVTLVAKADIYLELHRLLAGVTDSQHLDEFPRLELIDAVDADGDGRGELLFRRVFDTGAAWAVYRATADQLFPLFEGTPAVAHSQPVP